MKGADEQLQTLDEALAAMTRQHAVAVICAHLREYVADSFRGNETREPSKLLRTLDGSVRRADVRDVLVVEHMLATVVDDARREHARLRRIRVVQDTAKGHDQQLSDTVPGGVVDERRTGAVGRRHRG